MKSKPETPFLDSVAKRVAQLRHEHGLTQEQLADRSGLDRVVLANIETGIRRPTVTTMYRLAEGMGVKVEEFFRGL